MGLVLKSSVISGYIDWLGHIEYRLVGNTFTYDKKSYDLIEKIFDYIRMIEPISDNGALELWLTSERGEIDDFRNLDEAVSG